MEDNMKTQNQTQTFYDFLASRYDEYMGAPLLEEQVEQQKRAYSFWKDLPPKARILDCACGRGILILAWKQLGLDIQGSDLSEGMLSVARSNAQKLGIDAKFTQTAWEDLPQHFKEEFDVALCLDNSLISVTDDDALVRSVVGMRKVLKPGGICRIGLSAPIRLKEPGIPGGKFHLSVTKLFFKKEKFDPVRSLY
jgi:2-polyprenyl-3-methyl-5-hydroxy-6-metoxy-1,4-benzoquinol methylase